MKQNKNFNFKPMSSTNEKMLIIFSWIIVVIIVVLVGLYYGQQVREQEVSVARVQSAGTAGDVEISSDSDSKVEEGELSAAGSTESVLTDNMTLNKNEVFSVQIGSHDGPDFYGESKADEIIAVFSSKGLYSKKLIINPEKNQYVVQLGIFKNYEDAKTFLNSVKLKNYPAEITIVPDPNAKIDYAPPVVAQKTEVKKEVVVSTPDSGIIAGIKTPAEKPAEVKSPAPAAAEAAKTVSPVKAAEIPAEKPEEIKPSAAAKPAGEVKTADSAAAPAGEEPAAEKVEAKAPPAAETGGDFKIAAAKPEEIKPAEEVKPVEEAKPVEEIRPAGEKEPETPAAEKKEPVIKEEKKPAKPKEEKKETRPASKEPPAAEDDEITAGEDEFEIVADDEPAAADTGDKKGPYYIQIGTYKSNKNADVLKAKLKKLGMGNVSIVPGKLASGDSVYRVRITGYASKESASKAFNGVKGSFPDVKPYISK